MKQPLSSSVTDSATGSPLIWVLADDRAGNRAQCLGVADRLGLEYTVREIRYNALVQLPNMLRGASRMGVQWRYARELRAPWPDIVIAAGRRTAPVARWIKRQSPNTALVQMMWPDAAPYEFDCIVLPSHDRPRSEADNILRVLGAPHRITRQVLDAAADKWRGRLAHLPPASRIAVLVGGSTRHGHFTADDYQQLATRVKSFAHSVHGSLLLSTSRRTGREGEKILHHHLDAIPNHSHSWSSPKGEENPYLGYLALADAIVVTADSIAMCSEACASHKPVYIFQPAELSAKHRRFVDTLVATGYAVPFEPDFLTEIRPSHKREPLDSAETVAQHIRSFLLPRDMTAEKQITH